MADFPYAIAPNNLLRFFSHIQSARRPDEVTNKYLKESSFTSPNDYRIISVLKFIEFLDSSGVPTDRWMNYRDKNKAKGILAEAVQESYSDLFSKFPDAYRKDNEALRNYFSANTKAGGEVLNKIVSTFKNLCSLSDFEAIAKLPVEEKIPERDKLTVTKQVEAAKGWTLNINIQLQLPDTKDASVYDNFFAALKKHLLSD